MPSKHVPGCGCCGVPECILFEDDFTRADGNAVGSNGWHQIFGDTGTWAIASNELTTSNTNAEIRTPDLEALANVITFGYGISVRMKGSAGSILRLGATGGITVTIGGDVDIGGTTCASGTSADTWFTLAVIVCDANGSTIGGDSMQRVLIDGEVIAFGEGAIVTPSGTFGLSTGGTVSGTAYFDDYKVVRYGTIPETYTFSRTGSGGNTHYFTINGSDTAPMAYNASGATVEAAIEGLGYACTVTETAFPFSGYPYFITVDAPIPGDLTVTHTGGSATLTKTEEGATCPECQQCGFWPTNAGDGWTTLTADISGFDDEAGGSRGFDQLNATWNLDATDCDTEELDDMRFELSIGHGTLCQCYCFEFEEPLEIERDEVGDGSGWWPYIRYTKMCFHNGTLGIYQQYNDMWGELGGGQEPVWMDEGTGPLGVGAGWVSLGVVFDGDITCADDSYSDSYMQPGGSATVDVEISGS